ncbi:twitching motility protein PilT [Salinarchaeum sp. IM2453]|uniref:twitching motility protein PilT n=1 Tax=Salinarchaeum sp. IM2453 TaxID=2862870 RepID=UPI001C837978|nr:twitching motility protein PilT [Salinarchaeum sp. IM2453]QZA89412.1 twitching motility protein PilT [Salinarchaeum sp. IM2453]
MTTTVIVDTNALMMPVELDVRLFDEIERVLRSHTDDIEVLVPQPVIEELRRLSDKGGEEGIAASVGHDLATDRCVPISTEVSYADDAVVELAQEGTADYVVTNDQALQERILSTSVPIISLRGTNKLAITEP